jgi:hypothetical protein
MQHSITPTIYSNIIWQLQKLKLKKADAIISFNWPTSTKNKPRSALCRVALIYTSLIRCACTQLLLSTLQYRPQSLVQPFQLQVFIYPSNRLLLQRRSVRSGFQV